MSSHPEVDVVGGNITAPAKNSTLEPVPSEGQRTHKGLNGECRKRLKTLRVSERIRLTKRPAELTTIRNLDSKLTTTVP